ncbi:MAG: SdrD B-like domain-containing protein [Planctomycetota bacterium]
MISTRILTLAAAATFAAGVSAQQFCSDNTYPVHVVDANGVELPNIFDAAIGENSFQVPTEEVFLAFDPALPSGTYYVHVTDTPINGLDEVLSQNDPMDRFVHVENNAGVITLSLPFSSNPAGAVYGTGLNGVGQSLLVNPFAASQYSQCKFKLWFGDNWDLSNGPANPYLLAGGIHPVSGLCAVRSYHSFTIGDGNGSDVSGMVFGDDDRSGLLDGAEDGEAGRTVRLIGTNGTIETTTGADGIYEFANVAAGEYTVEVVIPSGYVATTATSYAINVCACAPVDVDDFGIDLESLPCNAKPLCYWTTCTGANEAIGAGLLQTLPMLCIVNQCGQPVAPSSSWQLRCYLANANSWNMAYALSAQLVTMQANVLTGRVGLGCVVCDPQLGNLTVGDLMQLVVTELCAHPFTPWCSSHRTTQTRLFNALKRANENDAWQCNSCGGGNNGHHGKKSWKKKHSRRRHGC